jgi:hypothetical protein
VRVPRILMSTVVGMAAIVPLTTMSVQAGAATGQLPLHNAQAAVYNTGSGECDHPDLDPRLSYWHFVITPNNGQYVIEEMHFVTTASGSFQYSGPLILLDGDGDNVYVQAAYPYTIDDIVAGASYAVVSPAPTGKAKFVLSHSCRGSGGGGDD